MIDFIGKIDVVGPYRGKVQFLSQIDYNLFASFIATFTIKVKFTILIVPLSSWIFPALILNASNSIYFVTLIGFDFG